MARWAPPPRIWVLIWLFAVLTAIAVADEVMMRFDT
jgi:hypothetical protein